MNSKEKLRLEIEEAMEHYTGKTDTPEIKKWEKFKAYHEEKSEMKRSKFSWKTSKPKTKGGAGGLKRKRK